MNTMPKRTFLQWQEKINTSRGDNLIRLISLAAKPWKNKSTFFDNGYTVYFVSRIDHVISHDARGVNPKIPESMKGRNGRLCEDVPFENISSTMKQIIGKKFGALNVKRYVCMRRNPNTRTREYVFLCSCECDESKEIEVRYSELITGHVTTCGCRITRKRDISSLDKTYGEWTVLREDGWREIGKDKKKKQQFICRCSCSTEQNPIEKSVLLESLLQGTSQSCGHGPGEEELAIRARIRSVRDTNRPFLLSDSQIRSLVTQNCYICDAKPLVGIDRVTNSIHYEYDNCAPCCWPCNSAKNNRSLQEHLFNRNRNFDRSELEVEHLAKKDFIRIVATQTHLKNLVWREIVNPIQQVA